MTILYRSHRTQCSPHGIPLVLAAQESAIQHGQAIADRPSALHDLWQRNTIILQTRTKLGEKAVCFVGQPKRRKHVQQTLILGPWKSSRNFLSISATGLAYRRSGPSPKFANLIKARHSSRRPQRETTQLNCPCNTYYQHTDISKRAGITTMGKLPTLPVALTPTRTTLLLKPSTTSPTAITSRSAPSASQVRHANFIARPRRPYTFTQLVTLSDGSAYTMRTTSPMPIYRAAKDTRNTLLWQPSEKSLKNVELDEAGRLAAFRERFGRGFDAATTEEATKGGETDGGYADLITGYAPAQDAATMKDSGPKKAPKKRK